MNGFDNFTQSVNAAAVALKGLEGPAQESADAIDQAFSKAGESLARSLGRAASDGKISMAELASAVISAVNAAARSQGGGLGDVLSGISSVFSGARADGGPVTRGGAYLVGERGPELFRPATSGSIETGAGGQNVNITLNVSGGGEGLIRSEAQIASALNRAARLGLR
ncbi:phage tail tape measure protein [Asticcacaulis machinosus]|uniref:Phage tail tape measure protein n=1 Tax=Asticcacaulis machinosus TaxID=2984211 RepID=A0ABT5HLZ1_9CAUL|nr:phage tail tape measure protein [Asticcacaulis machinosus]MDC7677252.1 phage tail tape measure protein [Asticcacaulis machinosus]